MERGVRIAFSLGATLMVLAIVLNIFHGHLGPLVSVPFGTLPLAILILLVIGEFVVFFLISLAVLLLKRRWRYVAHAAIIIVGWLAVSRFDVFSFALLIPMAMLWVFTVLGDRRAWLERGYLLAALSTSAMTMLVIVIDLAFGKGWLVAIAMFVQELVAMFGLFMAGTDFAEMGIVAVESATVVLKGLLSVVWMAIGLALIAIIAELLLWLRLAHLSLTDFYSTVQGALAFPDLFLDDIYVGVLSFLYLGFIYWMIIRRRKQLGAVHEHIDYRSLFLIVGLYYIAFRVGIFFSLLSDPSHLDDHKVQLFTNLVAFIFIVLMFFFGRRSERTMIRLAYGMAVGVFFLFLNVSRHPASLMFAVGSWSFLFLLFAPLSRKLRNNFAPACSLIVHLNLTFVAYAYLLILFGTLASKGHTEAFTVSQATILLVALGWDVVSSGQAITNRHSDAFPRLARVATFIAYILSVALLVMFSTAGHFVVPTNREVVTELVDPDFYVQLGLALFGAPLIFLMAAFKFRNLLAAADEPIGADVG